MIEPSRAADLVVLSAAAMRSSMEDVPARFEEATGHHVRFVFVELIFTLTVPM